MRNDSTADEQKDSLLMLCRGLPGLSGQPHARRSWRLLEVASRSHRVHLACHIDGPVCLDQWRAVSALTHRLVMQPAPWLNRMAGAVMPRSHFWRWLGSGSSSAFSQTLEDWRRDQTFDAVLCADPALVSLIEPLQARLKICDFPASNLAAHARQNQVPAPLQDSWRNRALDVHRRLVLDAADCCHLLTLENRNDITLSAGTISESCRLIELPSSQIMDLAVILTPATRITRKLDLPAPVHTSVRVHATGRLVRAA